MVKTSVKGGGEDADQGGLEWSVRESLQARGRADSREEFVTNWQDSQPCGVSAEKGLRTFLGSL